jgi:hypothetical protein
MQAYDKPWHGHFDMTKSIGPILSKSCAPNNGMLFSKAHW